MRLVGLLRQRLITVSNGKQENTKLEQIFRRFDVDQSQDFSIVELAGLCAFVGVTVNDAELQALMNELDTNQSGSIDFDEFRAFMLSDPYTKFKTEKWVQKA